MRVFTAFLLVVLLGCTAAIAQVGLPWPGPGGVAGGSAPFTSAGDVVSFTSWWGASFAYSAATRNTKAVNLCQPAGSNCVDVNSDATTGIVVNAPTVNSQACDNASHKCFVHTVYEKAGSGADMVQATGANEPQWLPNGCGSGIPGMAFTRANSNFLATSSGVSNAFGFLVSAVALRNSGQSANQNSIFQANAGGISDILYNEHNANNVSLYGGSTVASVTAADAALHADNGLFSDSIAYFRVDSSVDSTDVTGHSGPAAGQCIGTFNSGGSCSGGSGFMDGIICEVGIINNYATTATVDSLNTNQHSSVRYNF